MTAAAGIHLAACILLAAAGLAKLRRPGGTQAAVVALLGPRWRIPYPAVQLGGAAEAALGVAALVTGSRWSAVTVAACYLAFAGFVAASLAKGTQAGCGCFGQGGSVVPLGRLHLVANLGLATAAVCVAAAGGLAVGAGAERVVVSAAAAGLAWVIYLVLVPLPQLAAAVREPAR